MTPLRGILFFWLSKTYILVKMLWLQLVFASYSLEINWLLTLNLVSCLWHVYKVTQLCLTKQSWDHNSKMYEEKFISPTGDLNQGKMESSLDLKASVLPMSYPDPLFKCIFRSYCFLLYYCREVYWALGNLAVFKKTVAFFKREI